MSSPLVPTALAANNTLIQPSTWIGLTAIPLWALTPVFVVLLGPQSAFGLLAVRFLVSGSFLSLAAVSQGKSLWRQVHMPLGLWLLSFFGIVVSSVIYILALQHAPAAEANFINYLWPIYLVLLSAAVDGAKISRMQFIAIATAFAGAAVIMLGDRGLHLSPEYHYGYALALLAGFCWGLYSFSLRHFYKHHTNTIAGGPFLVFAAICFAGHVWLGEAPLAFNAEQWVYAIAFGLIPIGYVFWEHGMRLGQVPYLAIGAYFIPLLSAIALRLVVGHAWTWSLLIGGLMIVASPLLAHWASTRRTQPELT